MPREDASQDVVKGLIVSLAKEPGLDLGPGLCLLSVGSGRRKLCRRYLGLVRDRVPHPLLWVSPRSCFSKCVYSSIWSTMVR